MKILLIAGHGNGDPGACANRYKEAELVREIVPSLQNILSTYAEVDIFDMSKNMYKYLKKSAFNFKNYDYVFEVHFNAGVKDTVGNNKTTGTEILVHPKEKETNVENAILENICSLGFKSRGVKVRSNLQNMNVCKGKQGISYALLETCFIDDKDDIMLYMSKKDAVILGIANGIIKGFGLKKESDEKMARTVMKLPQEVFVQEMTPLNFEIEIVDKRKKDITFANYFNCGFFTTEKGGNTIPVGNLASKGKIISQSKDNADWINLAKKELTTIYTKTDGKYGITKTDSLDDISNLKTAVSGIPIILNGRYVSEEEIKKEGYFGNEMYNSWHGFLGLRHDKIVYVAMKCDFGQMCWALVALGIYNAIKLDGGGSFVLKNGEILKATDENRRIHNVMIWEE